ncbi:MAG: HlyD family efflux transporter periplasmic adaptor subunit [Aquabacterium sp.]|nr:HlyD family efflux transporter periplasmic adaptor subunit [Aquabacterium sp.]
MRIRRLTLQRIDAELTRRPYAPEAAADSPDDAHLIAQVAAQYRAHRLAFDDALAQETAALARARADLRAAQKVLGKLEQSLPVYERSAESFRKLVAQGYVSELASAEKSREATERAHDTEAQRASVVSLEAAIAQGESKLAALHSQYRSQLENERLETVAQLNRAEQELAKAQVKVGMVDVRAPVAGVVKGLALTSIGAVVPAGATLLNIVPVAVAPNPCEVAIRTPARAAPASGIGHSRS